MGAFTAAPEPWTAGEASWMRSESLFHLLKSYGQYLRKGVLKERSVVHHKAGKEPCIDSYSSGQSDAPTNIDLFSLLREIRRTRFWNHPWLLSKEMVGPYRMGFLCFISSSRSQCWPTVPSGPGSSRVPTPVKVPHLFLSLFLAGF